MSLNFGSVHLGGSLAASHTFGTERNQIDLLEVKASLDRDPSGNHLCQLYPAIAADWQNQEKARNAKIKIYMVAGAAAWSSTNFHWMVTFQSGRTMKWYNTEYTGNGLRSMFIAFYGPFDSEKEAEDIKIQEAVAGDGKIYTLAGKINVMGHDFDWDAMGLNGCAMRHQKTFSDILWHAVAQDQIVRACLVPFTLSDENHCCKGYPKKMINFIEGSERLVPNVPRLDPLGSKIVDVVIHQDCVIA